MKIEKFEDIRAWDEARLLVKMIYNIAKTNKQFYNDYKFKEQINNAAVSVMSNIAEGFSRHSNKEFVQFLFIAKGSVAEVQSHLCVALDQSYINQTHFREIYEQTDKVSRYISNFITYLLGKRNKQQQTATNSNKQTI